MSVRSSSASDHVERLDWITAGRPQSARRTSIAGARWRLSILDRYLIKELVLPAAFGAAAFTVFLFINSIILAANFIINKGVPFGLEMRYLVLQLPAFMYMILPFAALVGILLGIGRLAGHNEIAAMRTSGISLQRIALPCLVIGIGFTVLAFIINESIAPRAVQKSQVAMRQIVYHSTQPLIEPFRFIRTEDGKHVLYVESMDADGTMHDVEIYTIGSGAFPISLTAKTGRQVNGRIELADGVQSEFNSDGLVTRQQHFNVLEFPLGDMSKLYASSLSPWEMNSHDLAQQIRLMRLSGADPKQAEMLLQQKFAFPAACLISVLLGFPLAVTFGRRGVLVAAMLSIIAMFGYWAVLAISYALGNNGALPAPLAAWLPNVLAGGAGVLLLIREGR
jgi:lipopolysaccharide export system permease protein